jgi:hypothetical protein
MGKRNDRDIIWGAAEHWLNELNEYIVPGVLTKEERKSYRKQADKLKNAMAREAERMRRKAVRDRRKRTMPEGAVPDDV